MSVSVVVPAYDCAPYLREAIESALRDDPPPREVIVVDDGSSDRPEDEIAGLSPRVHFHRQENRGPGAARNAGIRLATGEVVAFLDGDDLTLPGHFRAALEVFERRPETPLVFGRTYIFTDGEPPESGIVQPRGPLGEVTLARLALGSLIGTSTAIAQRRDLLAVGGFDESREVMGGEDYNLWLRLARRAPIFGLDAIVAAYRMRAGSLVGPGRLKPLDRGFVALRTFLEKDPEAAAALGGREAALVRHCVRQARWSITAGDPVAARAALALIRGVGPTGLERLAVSAAARLPGPLARALGSAIRRLRA